MKYLLQALPFLFMLPCAAQDSSVSTSIFFPQPMEKSWKSSIGFTLTTTSKELTEEERRRLPCGDFHVLKRISKPLYLDGRIEFVILQNHLSAGPRYAWKVSDRFYLSVGNDIAYWFGFIKTNEINYKAYGFMDYPNASFGYRVSEELLLTLKAELQFELSRKLYVGDIGIDKRQKAYSGGALTLALEQPFFKRTHLTLAFRALYSDFYWATWFLFDTFERKIFHPQLIAAIIL
jgi:hypothetical protein